MLREETPGFSPTVPGRTPPSGAALIGRVLGKVHEEDAPLRNDHRHFVDFSISSAFPPQPHILNYHFNPEEVGSLSSLGS